jgi:hypothetical protein
LDMVYFSLCQRLGSGLATSMRMRWTYLGLIYW